MSGVSEREALREAIGSVIGRWYKVRLLRFNSGDDGSDDLLLRDEIARAVEPLIDAERDRVRVLAAAVPDEPWVAVVDGEWPKCYACGIPSVHQHMGGCPWLAAHAIKEEVDRELV